MSVRDTGFEGALDVIQVLKPQAIADATPVLSTAVDMAQYQGRPVLIANVTEVTPTVHTIAFTVTESATAAGTYAAATTTGTLTATSADGIQYSAIKRNPAKPFVKVTATGSHVDVDVIVTASILFLGDF